MKCDPRAYAQCPTHQYCGSCAADADFMDGSECDQFNQKVLSQPMTNGDRIRAMSNTELAEFLADKGVEIACFPLDFEYHKLTEIEKEAVKSNVRHNLIQWLRQPAEVEDGQT